MAEIVVFGGGDIARLAHHYFTTDSDDTVVAFAVDRAYRREDQFLGLPVVDFEDMMTRYAPDRYGMFLALSYAKMNGLREQKYLAAKALGYEWPAT